MTKFLMYPIIGLICFALFSCQGCGETQTNGNRGEGDGEETVLTIPNVNKDSVYSFVQKQVDFGPRVPGSEAHKKCSKWFKEKFESYGATVTMQEFRADFHFGASADAVNVIASFNPEHNRRVLLCAHWDSRHIADQDSERTTEAILGADDGGSGVAVLLEVARLIKENPIDLGVDIVLFDAEDQGDSGRGPNTTNTWCLGAQHWSRLARAKRYRANFGILLDMVGSEGARFTKEAISRQYAGKRMDKVWKLAADMGYGNYFVDLQTPGITDDHKFVNEILRTVPTMDIINRTDNGFGEYWHTHDDDMGIISKNTLGATGNVVLAVIYNESIGEF